MRDQASGNVELRTHAFGQKLLNQLFIVMSDIETEMSGAGSIFTPVVDYLRGELGQLRLNRSNNTLEEFWNWWISETSDRREHDLRLDAIELFCTTPFEFIRDRIGYDPSAGYIYGDAVRRQIATMNARMLEDGFGFQFEGGQIVEVGSEFTYEQAVAPALTILRDPAYAAANQEFRDALAEFRAGNFDDCIADCGNALESVLKVIAAKKGWAVKPNDRAAQLIEAASQHNLFPAYMQSQISGLRQVVTGIATVRNNAGGHGAGTTPAQVPKQLASYQINQTAATILFLADCAKT